MMGASQHGHMASIGYDLYCRMLEDTIKLIKGEIDNEPVETTVELKVDAYIPGSYIKDEVQKIEVYKKIAAIDSYEDMMEIQDELEDRFSTIPSSVYNLMNISYIRSIGKKLGIEEIKERKNEVLFIFESQSRINQNVIKGLLRDYTRKIGLKLGDKPGFAYKLADVKREDLILEIKELVQYMIKIYEQK